jgi:hypothetical protein
MKSSSAAYGQTDRQTDRRTDRKTDEVRTIAYSRKYAKNNVTIEIGYFGKPKKKVMEN